MAMELDNSFTVPVPPDQAWDVLLDVKRIAPCMPGATVDEVDGDVVSGRIKVKVGPVSLTYRGTAKFVERDPDAHHMVLEASGKETRGAGTASATIQASLAPDASGNGTQVSMHTTMNVTGRPAQFGRGVMVEIGGKLVEQFAANLAQLIAGDGSPAGSGADDGPAGSGADDGPAAPAGTVSGAAGGSVDGVSAPAATTDGPGGNGASSGAAAAAGPIAGTTTVPVTSADAPPQDSLNLVALVGPALLKRLVPVVVGVVGLAVLSRLLWRRRHGPQQAEQA
jgi:carbon monoxide dehydrogenase subunit G